ncbi:hypothetical protein [Thermaurantiacus sp.]
MDPTLLLLSALGVLGVTAIARAMGFAAAPPLDEATAKAEAERIPGFEARAVHLAADSRAALVEGTGGRLAAVLPLGDRFIARSVTPAMIAREGDEALIVDFAEPLLGRRRLALALPGERVEA